MNNMTTQTFSLTSPYASLSAFSHLERLKTCSRNLWSPEATVIAGYSQLAFFNWHLRGVEINANGGLSVAREQFMTTAPRSLAHVLITLILNPSRFRILVKVSKSFPSRHTALCPPKKHPSWPVSHTKLGYEVGQGLLSVRCDIKSA